MLRLLSEGGKPKVSRSEEDPVVLLLMDGVDVVTLVAFPIRLTLAILSFAPLTATPVPTAAPATTTTAAITLATTIVVVTAAVVTLVAAAAIAPCAAAFPAAFAAETAICSKTALFTLRSEERQ